MIVVLGKQSGSRSRSAIKATLGGGGMLVPALQAVQVFREAGCAVLQNAADHAVQLERLPAHHQDPFDRLLIAQAMSKPLRLLTADRAVGAYGDFVRVV